MADVRVMKRGKVYQYQFEIAPVDGKRKYINKSGFKTKKEAFDEGVKAYNEYEYSGKKVNVKDMSYSDYLDYWVDNYAKLNLRYSTIMSYCNIIKNHIKPRIGHYHKSYHFLYRNVQCIQVPALCGKTQFQQKQGLINSVGGYFLKVWSDKKGNIQYMEPEEVLFEEKDLWDEAGKDKNKVKKLVIKNGIY